jgi:histidinol-phosphate aminotransferase
MPKAKSHLAGLYRTHPTAKSRKDYLRLDMNEGVPGLPEDFVLETLAGIGSEILATYPEYHALQESLAAHNNQLPENITLSNGSDAAIKYIFDAFIAKGDKVLLTDPTFAMYPVYCQMFGAEPITLSYRPDLSFPLEDFADRLSSGVKLAVVVNPNNPTGVALDPKELAGLISEAQRLKVLIVVDEAYYYFYPETVAGLIRDYHNLIVLRTFSKLLSLASVRLGYAMACREISESLRKVKPTFDVNMIAVLFGQRILEHPEIIARLIAETNAGKHYLLEKLADCGIAHLGSEANFILIKCNGRGAALRNKLAENQILVGGGFSNPILQDYIRVTVGHPKIMKRFWKTFSAIWNTESVR